MKTETTIRRACNAVGLVVDGAIRHIETDYGPDESDDRSPHIETLFNAIDRELLGWDVHCDLSRRRDLVDDVEVLLDPTSEHAAELMEHMPTIEPETIKTIMLVLLSRHDLMP